MESCHRPVRYLTFGDDEIEELLATAQGMNPLVGTWRLVAGEIRDARGQLAARFVHGVIHYAQSGRMSAQCAVADRLAALTEYAYSGRYEVDP